MNREPKEKKKLNLDGDIRMRGRKVKERNKKRHPTTKKAMKA